MLKKIFSVTNEINSCHKIITVFGFKFKFKSSKLMIEKQNLQIKNLNKKLEQARQKTKKLNSRIDNWKQKLRPTLKYSKYAQYQINKSLIDIQIKKFKKSGIIGINQTEERTPKIIVSLTTFPERIGDVHYAVFSLLNQTVKPDRVILWLAEEQFPDREDDLSQELLDLKDYGLTIKYTNDIRSFKKSIPTLKEYKDDILVTADDDIYYDTDWLEKLYKAHLKNPNNICAHWVARVKLNNDTIMPFRQWDQHIDDESASLLNFAMTGAGVLFPPNSLYKDVLNLELINELSPCSDENWFWAMAILNKTPIEVVPDPIYRYKKVNVLRDCCFGNELTLARENMDSNRKDLYIQNIIGHYPQLLETLREEYKKNEMLV